MLFHATANSVTLDKGRRLFSRPVRIGLLRNRRLLAGQQCVTRYSKYLQTNRSRRPLSIHPTERRSNVSVYPILSLSLPPLRPDDRHALNINPRGTGSLRRNFILTRILSISLAEEWWKVPSSSINKSYSFDFDSVVRGRIFWRGEKGRNICCLGENPDRLFFNAPTFLPSSFVLVILFARIAKMRVTHSLRFCHRARDKVFSLSLARGGGGEFGEEKKKRGVSRIFNPLPLAERH